MLHFVRIALAVVSVFYGHGAASASTTGEAETLDCLADMNEVRTAAGLAQFKEPSNDTQKLPPHTTPKTAKGGDSAEAKKLEGTFAYFPGSKDCKAAVQYWKDGFSLFNNKLPPTYTAPNEPDVYTDRAVSFVALYNPQASPVASCAFVTCTTASDFAASALSRSDERRALRRLQGEEEPITAVICLTSPKALIPEAAPFKEDEWQKIVHAIVGTEEGTGASPVEPHQTRSLPEVALKEEPCAVACLDVLSVKEEFNLNTLKTFEIYW
ncbi:SAG family member [Eimeria necatrix]|uniref:SAG family member n=1 Tax=Eimeria necatrix TaxID=51315 RepID=U6MYY1_9EIME|nr:SAG family member [Eimeria necatrix]CDJ66915.1 SAG family member [Eimeria necatrix]